MRERRSKPRPTVERRGPYRVLLDRLGLRKTHEQPARHARPGIKAH